jgi:D-serine dehydratase
MMGPIFLSNEGKDYLEKHDLVKKMRNATHIIWATGGSMVPKEMMAEYYQKGSR